MCRYVLLVLLSSWSLVVSSSHACETGVAFTNSVLSIQRSLMANADVAFLKAYISSSVENCMEDCCSGKYGACTISSFKKNTTKENCIHYNCRPLKKCKFLSSPSTDSFTFSSSLQSPKLVPSNHSTTTTAPKTTPKEAINNGSHTKEEISTFSVEQFALKNDNTSIKPRKGVHDPTPDDLLAKSGIKPRKGVTLEDVPHSKFLLNNNKSNVKPRKGVGPYSSSSVPTPSSSVVVSDVKSSISPSVSSHYSVMSSVALNATADVMSDELISALERVFEDDPYTTSTKSSVSSKISPTSTTVVIDSTPSHDNIHSTVTEHYTTEQYSSTVSPSPSLQTSLSSSSSLETSSMTPVLDTSFTFKTDARLSKEFTVSTTVLSSTTYYLTVPKTTRQPQPPTEQPLMVAVTQEELDESVEKLATIDEETENDRKYKSSIHLVLSLVFGLLVLFAVLGVVAKRVYDGWLRRDYYRMNYLIDGIYNGVD
ncbi:uncharacterized protein CEXT_793221 [Caerostris extrusa]|uniref:Seven cysteines N-terminal domain-containing protein n=1 Tax=Caerostris extrusa TaxID=172846 RepID=A0AAV4V552_CAEEX|nr:uncharacterized protein CEXT_793221 [Caerostris extrusa]